MTQYNCSPKQILRTSGRLIQIAHGAIGGQPWMLEVDGARHGLASVQAGRLILDGHAYGFCHTGIDVELVNAGPHGIVYGLATRRYQRPIVIQATTKHGTAKNSVSAQDYPAMSRQIPGGTLFLRALPASACDYRGGFGLTAPAGSTTSSAGTSSAQVLILVGRFTPSCAPGQLLKGAPQGAQPSGRHAAGPAPTQQASLPRRFTLVPAVSQTPAAGACPEAGGGSTVTFYVGDGTPSPRCLKVRPDQRLELVNAEYASGPPDRSVTVAWAPFQARTLAPGQAVLFRANFGFYLATGDHEVGLSRYHGGGPEIWLAQ
jgi:hypothetical protein